MFGGAWKAGNVGGNSQCRDAIYDWISNEMGAWMLVDSEENGRSESVGEIQLGNAVVGGVYRSVDGKEIDTFAGEGRGDGLVGLFSGKEGGGDILGVSKGRKGVKGKVGVDCGFKVAGEDKLVGRVEDATLGKGWKLVGKGQGEIFRSPTGIGDE